MIGTEHNMTEREELLATISDSHKDAYGFRPRQDVSGMSLEELQKWQDRIFDDLNIEIEREEKAHADALRAFEATLATIQEDHNVDLLTALRWDAQAHDFNPSECQSIDGYFYDRGLDSAASRKYAVLLAEAFA